MAINICQGDTERTEIAIENVGNNLFGKRLLLHIGFFDGKSFWTDFDIISV